MGDEERLLDRGSRFYLVTKSFVDRSADARVRGEIVQYTDYEARCVDAGVDDMEHLLPLPGWPPLGKGQEVIELVWAICDALGNRFPRREEGLFGFSAKCQLVALYGPDPHF